MNTGKISPSMMCADPAALTETLREFEKGGIEYLHIDIMDGVFVPNFTLGTDYCKTLRKLTTIPLDIHLMITEPENKIEWFAPQANEIVAVHTESTDSLAGAIEKIHSAGAKAYVTINPPTPAEAILPCISTLDGVLVMCVNPGFAGQKMVDGSLEKIAQVRKLLDENGRTDAEIEVDGNVSFENAVKMRTAGADIFVAGTSGVFAGNMTLDEGIKKFRKCVV